MTTKIKPPFLSVVMSVYNEPIEWIQEAIDSILNQTFNDFEFIIINDNPNKEDLRFILTEYQKVDSRVILINNSNNIGLTKSLNKGLDVSKGKYIARMDADDISLPVRFEKQVAIMEDNPNIGIVGSWVEYFGQRNKIEKKYEYNDDLEIEMFFSAPFDHPATMMRMSSLKENNIRYDENLRYAQDRKLWFEMSKITDFYNIQMILFKHRANNGQVSVLHTNEQLRNAALIRREQIDFFFQQIGFEGFDYNNIDCRIITRLREFRKHKKMSDINRRKINKIIYVLFLSLNSYNFYSLFYFLSSMEYLNQDWNFKDFARIIAKNLKPDKIQRGGISLFN